MKSLNVRKKSEVGEVYEVCEVVGVEDFQPIKKVQYVQEVQKVGEVRSAVIGVFTNHQRLDAFYYWRRFATVI